VLHARRVFVSFPAEEHLTPQRQALTREIIARIKRENLKPEVFFGDFKDGLAAGKQWTKEQFEDVIRRCVGAVIIGLPRHIVTRDGQQEYFASEYCHYEGAVANTYQLPTLTLRYRAIEPRGIFHGVKEFYLEVPQDEELTAWLQTDTFEAQFKTWVAKVNKQNDVFLGYCGQAQKTAEAVENFLKGIGVSVLAWQGGFSLGGTILEEIQKAAATCTTGVFLFTRDDAIDTGTEQRMSPRDNVVFETGFFCHAKGKERVLMIVEEGAKIPTDLGGNIYASLPKRKKSWFKKSDTPDIKAITARLEKFLEDRI